MLTFKLLSNYPMPRALQILFYLLIMMTLCDAYHYTHSIVKETEMQRKGSPHVQLVGMPTRAATVWRWPKNSMEVPQKIENKNTI